ncbi:hypothetical protein [Rhodobacter capsulatus]|uniref:hypothetical protein n=1 Tax=Rhodobacter capsulatus TaxID=1061 RepID=UPI004029C48F
MVFASAIDATRNWTSTLTRFGYGVLVLESFSRAQLLPASLSLSATSNSVVEAENLPFLVLWVMLSLILGAVATMLGSLGKHEKFGELARVRRAFRVGKVGNPMLIELLRDGNSRYDLASGFIGALYMGLAGWGIAYVLSNEQVVGSGQSLLSNWQIGIIGCSAGFLSYLVKLSAIGGLEALDAILDDYEFSSSESASAEASTNKTGQDRDSGTETTGA